MSNHIMDSLYGALPLCCLAWRIDGQTEHRLQASADFQFGEAYPGFQGHFPEQPILPAIVQLAAVRYLCECALGCDLLPKKYNKIKFKGIIRPNERVVVTVDLADGAAGWHGSFSLRRPAGEMVASGSVDFFNKRDMDFANT
ncbi:MAG: hypothetical protein ACD_75C01283G0006 [uncultured bacterium]|nr:MAG: hypothetical protein ACD_75C01283G0006 [uncultured bacterium]